MWEYSVGLDINVDGKGVDLSIGTKGGITINTGNESYGMHSNLAGRFTLRAETHDSKTNTYLYSQFTWNMPETIAALYVLLLIFGELPLALTA